MAQFGGVVLDTSFIGQLANQATWRRVGLLARSLGIPCIHEYEENPPHLSLSVTAWEMSMSGSVYPTAI
jgi:hypothetical protein